MAATLFSGTLSFHAEVQQHRSHVKYQQLKYSLETIAGGKISDDGVFVTLNCLPFSLSVDNITQHTRTVLLLKSRNRVQRSVCVASLKDQQQEVFHPLDKQLKPIELLSPTPSCGNGIAKGEETAFFQISPEDSGFSRSRTR
uniref:Uncharacterized protein n=1 Tax=Physcomitrium patens TaxID=3218 RepID=A0A2K1LAN5_PHYPA|nr:hypothetical protein PHYPA_001512 [Physcomitrium patens]